MKGQGEKGDSKAAGEGKEGNQPGEGKGSKKGIAPGAEEYRPDPDGDTEGQGKNGKQPGGKQPGTQPGGKQPGGEKGQPGGEKGEPSDQKGEGQKGEGQQGKGQQKGEGQKGESQAKGEGEGKGQGEGEGKPSDKQGSPGAKPGIGRNSGEDNRTAKGGPEYDNTGLGTNDRPKATELTLRKLEDALKQKQIDPEILKRTGLDERQFRDRAKRILDKAEAEKRAEAMVGKERGGFGGKTDLRKRSDRAAGKSGTDDLQGLQEDLRTGVPESLRARYEAYQRSIGAGRPSDEKKTAPAPQ